MNKVKKPDLNVKLDAHRARFARAIAAEEFGPRFWGWRQWGEFEDRFSNSVERVRERKVLA